MDQGGTATLLPYKFTSKELDPETGLYYFGARYYDPRTAHWQSADPILDRYLNGDTNAGVYLPANLALYSYAQHNPVKLTDPNGESATVAGALIGGVVSAGIAVWQQQDARHVAAAFVHGAVAGAIAGSVIDTGGASLGALVATGAVSNVIGGVAGRLVAGDPTTAGAVVTDAASGAVGAAAGVALAKATSALASAITTGTGRTATGLATGGRAVVGKGAAGEEAVARAIGLPRNVGPGRVTVPGTGRGGFRVPDFDPEITLAVRGSVVEVKNVATLRITQQIRDLLEVAESRGGRLEIFTNAKNIPKTGELAGLIREQRIILRPIPTE